jgi:hypothetical protein
MDGPTWSFVVARNRTLDWRPVVAPDVLVDEGSEFRLVLEATGTHPIDITRRTWAESSPDAWSIAYRSVSAMRSFVGERGESQLLDRFGRPVFLIEGIAMRGESGLSEAACERLIDLAHPDALAAFAEFWSEDDESEPPQRSTAQMPTEPRRVSEVAPAEAAARPGGTTCVRLMVGALAVALIATLVLLIRWLG